MNDYIAVTSTLPRRPEARIAILRPALTPGTVVTGATAAWLYGVWDPPPDTAVPVRVIRGAPERRRLRRWEIADIDGVPVVVPLRAAFEQMRAEHMLAEAVARADAYLYAGLFTREALAGYVAGLSGCRGIRMARWGAVLARPGAESPGESRLRVQLMMAGLPEPGTQVPVGGFARLDLAYRHDGAIAFGIEYDGEVHQDPARAYHDADRDARFAFPCLRFTKQDVRERVAVARVTEQLRACGLLGERVYPDLRDYPWP
jgi:hypothetical protein